jgi:hypothetical protein
MDLIQRYYLLHYGMLIQPIATLSDLFSLHTLTEFGTGRLLFWDTHMNLTTSVRPVVGSILVWMGGGLEHAAIVTGVSKSAVQIIEQGYGRGKRVLPMKDGIIRSDGLVGWKMPPTEPSGV